MSTSSPEHTCPRCGGPLPGGPDGLCPRCLLAEAMEPTRTGDAPAAAPILTPEELAPHFPALEIVRCLGRGGMGVVYEARQKSLNRRVALKLLAPERADDPRFAARFEREAQALAALSHPHIVAVHDFGRAGGFYYLLMEFVDGLNLRQLLQSRRLSPREALAIVPPVCDALQCAHDHGIVHRDIKPENLLIDRAGKVKIADFGIAALVGPPDGDAPAADGAAASITLALGTPAYAAPEQATGVVDARADIFSLGVVLYEMLTGERPAQQITPPSKRVRVDIRIDEIVLRALEKTPELRFATAAEFGTQVEEAVSSFPQVPAGPSGEAAPRAGGFSWHAGAMLGSAIGISSWMPMVALMSHWSGAGAVWSCVMPLVVLFTALVVWTRRDRIPALRGHLILLASGFIASLAFLIIANSLGLTVRSSWPGGVMVPPWKLTWLLILFPVLAVWFLRQDRGLWRRHGLKGGNVAEPIASTAKSTTQSHSLLPSDQPGVPRRSRWPLALALATPALIAFALIIRLPQSDLNFPPLPVPSLGLGPWEVIILLVLGFFWSRRRNHRPNRCAGILLVWTLFHFAYVFLVLGSRSLLPVNPAGHFDAAGVADHWFSRDALLCITALLPPLLGLLFLAVAPLLRRVPARYIRVPRPDYWLAPERRSLLAEVVLSNFAALSCLFTLFFSGLHALVILANRQNPPTLPSSPLLFLVIAFLLLVLLWLVAFVVRLARAGDPPDRSPVEASVRILFMVWLAAATVGGGMVLGRYLHPQESSRSPVHLASLPAMDVMNSLELPWEARVHRDCALTLRHVWRDGGSEVMQVVSGPSPSSPERPVRVSVMLHKVSATRVGMRVQIGAFPQAKEFAGDFDLLAREMRERPWEGTRALAEDGVIELCRVAGAPVTLRVSQPPEPVPVAADASDPAWMEIVREGNKWQKPFANGNRIISGWHAALWVVRASRPGWVEIHHGVEQMASPLVRDKRTGLYQLPLHVDILPDSERCPEYRFRLGEPDWPHAPAIGLKTRSTFNELSRELNESGLSSIRPPRGREVEICRLDGHPATVRVLEGPALPPSADRDLVLSSAMEAIRTGEFCLLGIPGQTSTNLTHDAETGYPIVWLPAGGPAESLALFNETMRAWFRRQAESRPEK